MYTYLGTCRAYWELKDGSTRTLTYTLRGLSTHSPYTGWPKRKDSTVSSLPLTPSMSSQRHQLGSTKASEKERIGETEKGKGNYIVPYTL